MMRAPWVALLIVAACQSPGERVAEEKYADRVIEILTAFENDYAPALRDCERGPLDCAVAAHDVAVAVRRARSDLAALTAPEKLRDANQRLMDGLDHLAGACETVADTCWDRSNLLEAYTRAS
jgi:hypothetical protein